MIIEGPAPGPELKFQEAASDDNCHRRIVFSTKLFVIPVKPSIDIYIDIYKKQTGDKIRGNCHLTLIDGF